MPPARFAPSSPFAWEPKCRDAPLSPLSSHRLSAEQEIKLSDFGLSAQLNRTQSLATSHVGTPYYMAPEIYRNEPYGPEADLWSLGVLVFELLALRRPFAASSKAELVSRVLAPEYDAGPDLTECGHPPELQRVAVELLQAAPEQRMTLVTMQTRLEEARDAMPAAPAPAPAAPAATAPAAAAPAAASPAALAAAAPVAAVPAPAMPATNAAPAATDAENMGGAALAAPQELRVTSSACATPRPPPPRQTSQRRHSTLSTG